MRGGRRRGAAERREGKGVGEERDGGAFVSFFFFFFVGVVVWGERCVRVCAVVVFVGDTQTHARVHVQSQVTIQSHTPKM